MYNHEVKAHIHSKGGKTEPVTIEEITGHCTYIVRTQDGVRCTAIYNVFVNCYYADDLYGKV